MLSNPLPLYDAISFKAPFLDFFQTVFNGGGGIRKSLFIVFLVRNVQRGGATVTRQSKALEFLRGRTTKSHQANTSILI